MVLQPGNGTRHKTARHRHQQCDRWRYSDCLCAGIGGQNNGTGPTTPKWRQHSQGHSGKDDSPNLRPDIASPGRNRVCRRRPRRRPGRQSVLLDFEAFPVLDQLAPSPVWSKLRTDGLALLGELRFGPKQLPADWVSLKSAPGPAVGFPAEFGYNAVRIPLYLVRAGVKDRDLLTRLMRGTTGANGGYATIDIVSGLPKDNLADPGYRIINYILACVLDKTAVPEDVKQFAPTRYYPSTLHLLGLSFIAAQQPECL